jgi:hypothetical protein
MCVICVRWSVDFRLDLLVTPILKNMLLLLICLSISKRRLESNLEYLEL